MSWKFYYFFKFVQYKILSLNEKIKMYKLGLKKIIKFGFCAKKKFNKNYAKIFLVIVF